MPRNDNELLKCFDDEGREVDSLPRYKVHQDPLSVWHGVTSIWILNQQGKILCSKRGEFVETSAGMWQINVGGHVLKRQSFVENAAMELQEELGLKLPLTFIEIDKTPKNRHIRAVFGAKWNGSTSELNFVDKEIAEVKWMSFEEYEKDYQQYPERWKRSAGRETYMKVLQRLVK